MEVLKHGKHWNSQPEYWTRKVTCSKCKAVLTVDAEDLYPVGSSLLNLVVSCVECEGAIAIRKVPKIVRESREGCLNFRSMSYIHPDEVDYDGEG